jgi:hypothetical protein
VGVVGRLRRGPLSLLRVASTGEAPTTRGLVHILGGKEGGERSSWREYGYRRKGRREGRG